MRRNIKGGDDCRQGEIKLYYVKAQRSINVLVILSVQMLRNLGSLRYLWELRKPRMQDMMNLTPQLNQRISHGGHVYVVYIVLYSLLYGSGSLAEHLGGSKGKYKSQQEYKEFSGSYFNHTILLYEVRQEMKRLRE